MSTLLGTQRNGHVYGSFEVEVEECRTGVQMRVEGMQYRGAQRAWHTRENVKDVPPKSHDPRVQAVQKQAGHVEGRPVGSHPLETPI